MQQLSGHPNDTDMSRINSVPIAAARGLWLGICVKCLVLVAFKRAESQLEMCLVPFDRREGQPCLSAAGEHPLPRAGGMHTHELLKVRAADSVFDQNK